MCKRTLCVVLVVLAANPLYLRVSSVLIIVSRDVSCCFGQEDVRATLRRKASNFPVRSLYQWRVVKFAGVPGQKSPLPEPIPRLTNYLGEPGMPPSPHSMSARASMSVTCPTESVKSANPSLPMGPPSLLRAEACDRRSQSSVNDVHIAEVSTLRCEPRGTGNRPDENAAFHPARKNQFRAEGSSIKIHSEGR